jgi:hypothetical protein
LRVTGSLSGTGERGERAERELWIELHEIPAMIPCASSNLEEKWKVEESAENEESTTIKK